MNAAVVTTSLTEQTQLGIRDILDGRKKGVSTILPFAGPAVVASVAYIDPGNFATNIQAGAKYGYELLWVVLTANLIAMLFQSLSAKLGIVTDRNLPELCREHLPQPLVWGMWVVSELAAMATDLAEFLGGAIGFSLLLNIPLLPSMSLVAIMTFGILHLGRSGFRPFELVIALLVGIIGLCYLFELLIVPVDWGSVVLHSVTPKIANEEALMISVGIMGATVMPHAIYLHSSLTQRRIPVRHEQDRHTLLSFSNREVVIALAISGLINMAMVIMASGAFRNGHSDVAEIGAAYHTLTPLFGAAAAGFFVTSLIASGVSSSAVGTLAGQVIMQGFVKFHIPLWVRRVVTMAPAFAAVMLGMESTQALVLSQVLLSITLPLPMIALVYFTSRKDIMGAFVSSPLIKIGAIVGTLVVLLLNGVLLIQAGI